MKYFVIAGNWDQYTHWRRQNRIRLLEEKKIETTSDLVYIDHVGHLKGYSNPTGIFIGTWYKRKDIKEILIQLNVSMTKSSRIEPLKKAWDIVNEK